MGIYTVASNQAAISTLKTETRDLRRQMLDPLLEDRSEFAELGKKNLKVSLTLLGKVIFPAFLSALPVLLMVVWLDTFHGYALPGDHKAVSLTVVPAESDIKIFPSELVRHKAGGGISILHQTRPNEISIYADEKLGYVGNPFAPPVPVIAKEKWWNLLLAEEAGYLTPDAPIQEIRLDFPKKHVLERMPGWAAGRELPFFISLLLS